MSSDLARLTMDLATAGVRAGAAIVPVVTRGAGNIQRDARQMISGLAHAPHYPRSITFDVDVSATAIEAEIGPDKDLDRTQADLGNLLEYGSANNPPHAHLGPALDREGPNFEEWVGNVAAGLL